jgi:DNA-directed RNA polymerase subunit RPC12/RpoP
MKPPIKKIQEFIIHCSYCNTKKVIKDINKPTLTEIPTVNPQGKIFSKEFTQIDRGKLFKCPNCGRGVRARVVMPRKEESDGEKNIPDGR